MRKPALNFGKHHIYMVLMLEGALNRLIFSIFDHKIGDGTKNTLSGESTLAYGHALVCAPDIGYRHIKPSIKKKTVQIQGFSADAAGTEYQAGFPVFLQLPVFQSDFPNPGRFEIQHQSFSKRDRFRVPMPSLHRNRHKEKGPPLTGGPHSLENDNGSTATRLTVDLLQKPVLHYCRRSMFSLPRRHADIRHVCGSRG